MSKLIALIVPKLIELCLKALKPSQIEAVADKALDWCENAVEKSSSELDNSIVLPLISIVREAFSIEDND